MRVLAEIERLRGSFGAMLHRQTLEAQALWREARKDADLRDALIDSLSKIRTTSASLGLVEVEQAAAEAVAAAEGGLGPQALDVLLEQCRSLDGVAPVLRPLIVALATGPTEAVLRQQAEGLAVVVQVVHSAEQAVALAQVESPAAILIPSSALDSLSLDNGDVRGVPFYVYGEGRDLADRLLAARFGAAGYLPLPLDLRAALPMIRARLTASSQGGYRIAVIAPTKEAAGMVGGLLIGDPARVVAIGEDMDLLAALDDSLPDLIAICSDLRRLQALDLVSVLRAHHRHGEVPRVLVVDDARGESQAMLTDAEGVLRRDLPPSTLKARVSALLERARRERALRDVELETGALSRAALLRAADREIAAARRFRAPLCVLRTEVDRLREVRKQRGEGTAIFAERCLALALRDGLRETDSVGHIGASGFATLLPNCSAANGRIRLTAVRARFKERLSVRPALASLTLCAGLADTTEGFEDVLQRADRQIVRARSLGFDGTSGGG